MRERLQIQIQLVYNINIDLGTGDMFKTFLYIFCDDLC